MVAIAMGIIAATAVQDTFGRENAGTAKIEPSPSFQTEASSAAAGMERNRFAQPAAYAMPATAQPVSTPRSRGSWPRKPFRYFE